MSDLRLFAIPDEPDDVHAVRDADGDLRIRLTPEQMKRRYPTGRRPWDRQRINPAAHWFTVTTAAEMEAAYSEDVDPADPAGREQRICGNGETWVGMLTMNGPLRDVTQEDRFVVDDQ